MPRGKQQDPAAKPEGSSFPWTVEQYDARVMISMRVIVMIGEAKDRVARRSDPSVALRSAAEIELAELERRLAGRELRVRAEAGDPEAVAGLIEEAARYELRIEAARETARATAEGLGLPWPPRAPAGSLSTPG